MKRKEVIAEFNTRLDSDQGYGDHIDLDLISSILKFQNEKYVGTDVYPKVRLIGDTIQIYKDNQCTKGEAGESLYSELSIRVGALNQDAAELRYILDNMEDEGKL